jgi:hypothetical protein
VDQSWQSLSNCWQFGSGESEKINYFNSDLLAWQELRDPSRPRHSIIYDKFAIGRPKDYQTWHAYDRFPMARDLALELDWIGPKTP